MTSHRRRAGVIGAIVVVAALLAWLLPDRDDRADGSARPSAAAPAGREAGSDARPGFPPAFLAGMDRQARPDELDLCGFGPVTTGPGGPLAAIEREARQILGALAQHLRQSGSEADRSLGLALEARLARTDALHAAMRAHPGCESDPACSARAADEARRAQSPVVDALAAMAIATRDPQVYANALRSCISGPSGAPGNCTRVTFAGWAALEPTNAAPWIGALAEARARGDGEAMDAAVNRIAAARTLRARNHPVAAAIDALPRTTEATRAVLLGELADFHVGVPLGGYQHLIEYCRQPDLELPGRPPLCRSVAQVLSDHGETLMDLSVAATLAAQTGTPADEVLLLREEVNRLNRAMAGHQGEDLYSCGWLANAERWIPQMERGGELRLARSLPAPSARTR